MEVKFHEDIEQGGDQWLAMRLGYFTASDAAAMLGESKYKSRNQLLHEKKTGQAKEVSKALQEIFDRGHAAEAAAREIIEMELLEDFSPAISTRTVDDLELMASLDGYNSGDVETIFEHKLWNETLAENVRNGVLEPDHYWQLEHQLLVTSADVVRFVVSDGTKKKWAELEYRSDSDRQGKLITGWLKFAEDLETYTPQAKQEKVVGAEVEAFPLVEVSVNGSLVTSNLEQLIPLLKERAEVEINRTLETDQDFADKENFNKEVKAVRQRLKDKAEAIEAEFVSLAEFNKLFKVADEILQKMQSHGEKQVKQAKEQKKQAIVDAADKSLLAYIDECNNKISPLSLFTILPKPLRPDFESAMKGKRNIESLQNAVDQVLTDTKIELEKVMARIVPNQIFLKEHAADYHFLFADVAQIINQDTEPFQAVVKSRIADHKAAEEKRLEEERERIRREEQQRIENERKAEQERTKADEAKQEEVKDETVSPETIHRKDEVKPHVAKPVKSFAQEMADWAEEFSISEAATEKLAMILERHIGKEKIAS